MLTTLSIVGFNNVWKFSFQFIIFFQKTEVQTNTPITKKKKS